MSWRKIPIEKYFFLQIVLTVFAQGPHGESGEDWLRKFKVGCVTVFVVPLANLSHPPGFPGLPQAPRGPDESTVLLVGSVVVLLLLLFHFIGTCLLVLLYYCYCYFMLLSSAW